VVSSVYGSKIADFFVGKPAPKAAVDAAKNSLGGAIAVAQNAAKSSIPGAKQLSESLVHTANSAFVDAFHWGAIVGACTLALGALIVILFLPARATDNLAPHPATAPDDAEARAESVAAAGGPIPSPVPGAASARVPGAPNDLPENVLT